MPVHRFMAVWLVLDRWTETGRFWYKGDVEERVVMVMVTQGESLGTWVQVQAALAVLLG